MLPKYSYLIGKKIPHTEINFANDSVENIEVIKLTMKVIIETDS